jgi:hypothetical protein
LTGGEKNENWFSLKYVLRSIHSSQRLEFRDFVIVLASFPENFELLLISPNFVSDRPPTLSNAESQSGIVYQGNYKSINAHNIK